MLFCHCGPENEVVQGNHCVKSVRIRSYSGLYSVWIRENAGQNNSEYWHFLRSESWNVWWKAGWETQTKNILIQHFIQHNPTMLDEMLDSFCWALTVFLIVLWRWEESVSILLCKEHPDVAVSNDSLKLMTPQVIISREICTLPVIIY